MGRLFQILTLIRPYWKYIGQAALAGILLIFLQLPAPFFTRLLIDAVFPGQDVSLLNLIVIVQFAVTGFSALVTALRSYFTLALGLHMGMEIGRKFFAHIQKLSFSFFDQRRTGDLLSRFSDAHASIDQTVTLLGGLIIALLQLVVFPPFLLLMSWKLTVVALFLYPVDLTVYAFVNRRIYRYGKSVAEAKSAFNARAYEALSGIRTIQALGVEEKVNERVTRDLLTISRQQLRLGRLSQAGVLASGIIRAISAALFMWYGWHKVLSGELTLGSFMAFNMYVGFLYSPLRELFSLSQGLEQALVHTGRFLEIYELKPEVDDRANGAVKPAGVADIDFVNVSFRYGAGPRVLHEVNLRVPGGQMTAIVGRSGVGKTTLVSLIPRFYDTTSGYVTLGGVDLREIPLAELRRRIGYVMQRSNIFYGTLYDELTLGNGHFTMDCVEEAARKAHIKEFVDRLPDGYRSRIGEGGIGLSEGQRQRLAIARVLLQNRPILILDEPTSALDHESEQYLRASLQEVRQNRTVIIIAHRLSTIAGADNVVVMEGGRIVESGTFAELSRGDGAFGRLYQGYARV